MSYDRTVEDIREAGWRRMKLGKHQLKLLLIMGSGDVLLTPREEARSLQRRGLLGPYRGDDRGLVITPTGLRALADALEGGQLEQFKRKVPA